MLKRFRDQWGESWQRARMGTGFQVLFILGIWRAGEGVARGLHLPLPGSVLAMALLLGLLAMKIITPEALQRGVRWFLAELTLFLLPSVMSLPGHHEFFGWLGLKLLGAIVAGTLLVMLVTGLVVDGCYRWLALKTANKI